MTNKGLVFFVCLFLTCTSLLGQDAHFSQATNFPLLLNPAYMGMFDGKTRAIASFRNQNMAIPNTAFTGVYNTFGLSAETKIFQEQTNQNTWTIGAMALSDYAGSGTLATNQFMLNSAYSISMDRYGRSYLSIGAQIGLISRRLFSNDLLFETQVREYDFDPRLPNLETFLDGSTKIVPSANIGVVYQQSISDNAIGQLGFSLYNINKPKDFFLSNSDINIYSRVNLSAGLVYLMDETSRFFPSIVYMKQGAFQQINAGFSYTRDISDRTSLIGSFRSRIGDAYILGAGLKFDKVQAVVSYDITSSSLSNANKSIGALELNLSYIFGESQESYHSNKQYCPSY